MKKTLFFLVGMLANISQVFSQVSLGVADNTNSPLPIDAYYTYSYSQTIYLADEINTSGSIDSICFRTLSGTNLFSSNDWLVLVGYTPLSEFGFEWINAALLDTVFDGQISITNDTVYIPFDNAFFYDGNQNLVIAVLEKTLGYNGSLDRFYCTNTPNSRSRGFATDLGPIDPYTITDGNNINAFSDITFFGISQSCPQPSNLVVDSINSNFVAFSWNGNNFDFEVDLGEDGLPLGQGNVFSTQLDSVSVDTLLSATNYRIYVREICGVGDTSAWTGPLSFTTACGIYMPDYLQEFTDFPLLCWEMNKGQISDSTAFESVSNLWVETGFANSGGYLGTGAIKTNLYSNTKEWLISPTIDLGNSSTDFQLSFDAALTQYNISNSGTFDADDSVFVVISTDNGITWSQNDILYQWHEGVSLSNSGEEIVIDLSDYTGLVKLAFYVFSSTTASDLDFFIDNFLISSKPPCPQPTLLSVSNIEQTSGTISWTGADSLYFVEYGVVGFTQDTANIVNVINDTLIVTDLSPNTDYEFYVSSFCDDGDTSLWSGPIAFTTLCENFIAPTQLQTFDVIAPDCWVEAKGLISDSTNLSFHDAIWTSDFFGNNALNSMSAKVNLFGSNIKEWLISPSIDLGNNGQNFQLEFDIIGTAYSGVGPAEIGVDDTVRVLISTDNGITWSKQNSLDVWTSTTGIPNTSTHQVYDLSSYSSLVKFAFYAESTQSGNDFNFYIDNFKVKKCTQHLVLTDTVCNSYTSPISGNVYTQTGVYTDTISNTMCDSIYTINLTVNSTSLTSVNVLECDTFISANGNIYTQTGTYIDTIQDMFNCDSIVETNLSIMYVDLMLGQTQNIFLSSNETDPAATYQWLNCSDLSPISGATSRQYTATALNDYACQITIGNCTKTTECITVSSLDTGQVSISQFSKSDIKVYPNPNNGQFTLELSDKPQSQLNLTISNALGQIVHQQQLISITNSIDLANVNKGIYIMDLSSPTQSLKTRIVIE
ncbi:MAG: fibronectin type III domain-containing protein [Flavobacteriales bacterium]|nr:fibronectin type III domain-containing protein [Flavobacteriales bacterium]